MATMRILRRTCLTGLLAGLLLAPPLLAQAPEKAPEAATGTAAKALVSADKFMVIAANPLASRAGAEVLAKGGTAADAAIAVQLVLNLVEPQSSGIGGGAFVLYYDKAAGKLTSYDGREIAPEKATPLDDVESVLWVDPTHVKPEELAFPSMRRALAEFLKA